MTTLLSAAKSLSAFQEKMFELYNEKPNAFSGQELGQIVQSRKCLINRSHADRTVLPTLEATHFLST